MNKECGLLSASVVGSSCMYVTVWVIAGSSCMYVLLSMSHSANNWENVRVW